MHETHQYYPACPEAMIVGLAQNGDRSAFEELVRRRQSAVRGLMRRCCGDITLADDLAQQAFIQVWLKLHMLRDANAFGAWLNKLVISVWLQHLRKKDALRGADELVDGELVGRQTPGTGIDLDRALASLGNSQRLCVVLSYQQGMSHAEIAKGVDMPLGTVKSHIQRGTEKLRDILSAYRDKPEAEEP